MRRVVEAPRPAGNKQRKNRGKNHQAEEIHEKILRQRKNQGQSLGQEAFFFASPSHVEIKNPFAQPDALGVTSTNSSGAMYSIARSREKRKAGVRASDLSLPAAR